MYLATKIDPQIDKVLGHCKDALCSLSRLWSNLQLLEIVIPSQKSLYYKVPRDGSLYLIKEGTLKCVKDNKVLYYVEEGDLVGFEGSAFDSSMDFEAEFAVAVCKLDPKIFLKDDQTIKDWNTFQGSFLNAILQTVSHVTKAEPNFTPEVRNFEAGEIIIKQGDTGTEIFSLIDGIAETEVDGNQVGEILPDQLFGAISVLTSRPSIATVKAMTDCMVIVLSKKQFLSMVESKPDTLLKLAEDLSKAIVALSEEVSGLVRIT